MSLFSFSVLTDGKNTREDVHSSQDSNIVFACGATMPQLGEIVEVVQVFPLTGRCSEGLCAF